MHMEAKNTNSAVENKFLYNLIVNDVQFPWFHSVNFQNPEFSLRIVWANNIKSLKQH